MRNRNIYHDKNIFFITTTCNKWLPLIEETKSYSLLENSLSFCCGKYNAAILGYVIMPNHIHLIIHFERGESRVRFMRDFKKFTSTRIRTIMIEEEMYEMLNKIAFIKRRQRYKVWQDRYDEVYLENKNYLETKLNYIHNNPLQEKWRLVKYPEDYSYSSALYYEKREGSGLRVQHYLDYV